MEQLSDIFRAATAAIEREYFRLEIAGGDPIYRERVYCYELYHQMRSRWPDGTRYYLNGEVDKAAHPILSELGISLSKPDLLVHQPGYMEGNHAVIEVKHSAATAYGLKKDLRTLSAFVSKVGYQRAILLIYGVAAADQVSTIRREAAKMKELAPVEIWLHREVGSPAEHILTLGHVEGWPSDGSARAQSGAG